MVEEMIARRDDPERAYTVLIADLVCLKLGPNGRPDPAEIKAYVEHKGGEFHLGAPSAGAVPSPGKIHFFYQPELSTEDELLAATGAGQYDAVIAAATFLPEASVFAFGGVRIGAGTGNMKSASWGGGSGEGGMAPLMNTPGINSRATAQMVMKAILKVSPDLPVDLLHAMVASGNFDTGKQLRDYPTSKIEGQRLAVIGYGNIGREVALLGRAFGMAVTIHARERHREWIESEGFAYAATVHEAAAGADVLSVHVGLGAVDAATGRYANAGLIGTDILDALNDGAIVVNYDRGEVVDAAALDGALESGKVRHAAIDADLFKNPETDELSGPMVPYLPLAFRYPGRLELLPHAAADTDHPSRVAGAKQAIDQIFDAIQFGVVTNLKGSLPDGYRHAGTRTADGVGAVTARHLHDAAADAATIGELYSLAEESASFWAAIAGAGDDAALDAVIAQHGRELLKISNRYTSLLRQLGLQGPYQD